MDKCLQLFDLAAFAALHSSKPESKEDGANPCNKDISGRQALVHTAFMPELQMYIHKILQLALNSSKLTEIYSNNYMN